MVKQSESPLLCKVFSLVMIFNHRGVLVGDILIDERLVVGLALCINILVTRLKVSLVYELAVHCLQVVLHELI